MKLLLPDACWRPDVVSGASFLYFHDDQVVLTLHPSVSTFLAGVDPFSFIAFVENKQPGWRGDFSRFVTLWRRYRATLDQTDELLRPLRKVAFKTILLSYRRDRDALDANSELLASSSLGSAELGRAIDPYSAADELFSHIFFEKCLELYPEASFNAEVVEALGASATEVPQLRTVDWRPLYAYCEELFSSKSLEELLTAAYLLRLPALQLGDSVFLSNDRMIPLLTSLSVDGPNRRERPAAADAWDVAGWEFFRQLVSPRLDPLDKERVSRVVSLLDRRVGEIDRLKARCLKLAQEVAEDRLGPDVLPVVVRTHIRANVEKEVQAVLDLDRNAAEDFLTSVFSDEKAWAGVLAFLYSLVEGGPILAAGSAIYALANIGSKTVTAAAKRHERLKVDDFTLLYRMRSL